MEVCPYSYFQWYGELWLPWVSFVTTDEFPVRVRKITSRISVLWTHSLPFHFLHILTQWIMVASLSKGCKPDNFELHSSLKVSFMNIQGLRLNFVDCESFLESNSPDIIALCKTNLHALIDCGNFSLRKYVALIQNDSTTLCMVSHFMWRKDFLLHRTYI